MSQSLRDIGMRENDQVLIASNYPTDEFPDVLEAGNGEKLYRHRDKEIHDEVVYMLTPPVVNPAEPKPEAHDPAVVAMGVVISEAIAEQLDPNMIDNLGDGESIVFMDDFPVINIVQLAEKIVAHQRSHKAALEKQIKVLTDELVQSHNREIKDGLAGK